VAGNNVVNLFDVMPSGGAQDPNDPVTLAASGQVITAKSPQAVVKKLQLLLTAWGFAPGSADGVYGTNTANAVRGLQAKLDVKVDGFFGPATAKAVQADLASRSSVLRANKAMFSTPALPPATGTRPVTAPPPAAGGPLPATQPAITTGVPWWVWLGGAAAVVFLISRTRDLEDTPLAPPGSVVADLGDEDDYVSEEEEVEEEPPPPKPKKKRKPRKKKAVAEVVSEVKTPDEVLPPADDAVDVEFTEVE
jgi:hypothetical protein